MLKQLLLAIMSQSGMVFTVLVMFGMEIFIIKWMTLIIFSMQTIMDHGAGNLQTLNKTEETLLHMKEDIHANKSRLVICNGLLINIKHKIFQCGQCMKAIGLR